MIKDKYLKLSLVLLLIMFMAIGAFILLFKMPNNEVKKLQNTSKEDVQKTEKYKVLSDVKKIRQDVNQYVTPIDVSGDKVAEAKILTLKGYVKSLDQTKMVVNTINKDIEINIRDTKLRCLPLMMPGPEGKELPSSQVYIDLYDLNKINSQDVTADKIVSSFGIGSSVVVRVERVGQELYSQLFVGFGCDLTL